MNIKLTNSAIIIFIAVKCFSQENAIEIKGEILSFNKKVSDVHIINLSNGIGTISGDNGEFEINVSLNDILLISSIQYNRQKINITKSILTSKKIKINLIPSVNILDEVVIHGLSGNLTVDIRKVPKDNTPKMNFKFNKNDIYKVSLGNTFSSNKPPSVEHMVNPITMNGVGTGASFPNYAYEAQKKLKKELNLKKETPLKIITTLGEDFFINELKIAKDSIHHFLTYCETRNVIQKYNQNKLLELIKILQEESKSYHAIKNQ
ncbi:hypothetical protein [Lutibacter sp. B1]|uniref:hypothetical protein n=1 Tax=Lutibacter sp. B1 TaxID=2725996 RepID=UPI00145743BF|nr:hypothetical protein [Lutibacter sp. B1]NLP57982.1 hypothetical protein [Lutibacter sp. B1]